MIKRKAQGCLILVGLGVILLSVITWAVGLAYFYKQEGPIGDIVFGAGIVLHGSLIMIMIVRQVMKIKNESNIYPDENGRLPTIQTRPWWGLGILGSVTWTDLNLVAHEHKIGRSLSENEMKVVGLNVLANSKGGTQPAAILKDMVAQTGPAFLQLPEETQRGTPLLIEARKEMQVHYDR